MSHFDERPYIRELENWDPISVWEVDGAWVRKNQQKEFTNFAQWRHPLFKGIIPANEFWIDQGSSPEEHKFFIEHMLHENYLQSRGLAFKKAEREATRVEERERHRVPGTVVRSLSKFAPERQLIQKVGEVEIFAVDGKMVRDNIDPRFCHGGHDWVYSYVPDKHIWIDDTVVQGEWPYLMVHELMERNKMELGEEYGKAHPACSKIEWKCRHDHQELLRQEKELGLL